MKKNIILSLCILVCFMLPGCGQPSPSDAVQTWFDAIESGNLEKANSVTIAKAQMLNAIAIEANQSGDKMPKMTIEREEIKGDKATVYYSEKGGSKHTITLEKVDGAWKVAPSKD